MLQDNKMSVLDIFAQKCVKFNIDPNILTMHLELANCLTTDEVGLIHQEKLTGQKILKTITFLKPKSHEVILALQRICYDRGWTGVFNDIQSHLIEHGNENLLWSPPTLTSPTTINIEQVLIKVSERKNHVAPMYWLFFVLQVSKTILYITGIVLPLIPTKAYRDEPDCKSENFSMSIMYFEVAAGHLFCDVPKDDSINVSSYDIATALNIAYDCGYDETLKKFGECLAIKHAKKESTAKCMCQGVPWAKAIVLGLLLVGFILHLALTIFFNKYLMWMNKCIHDGKTGTFFMNAMIALGTLILLLTWTALIYFTTCHGELYIKPNQLLTQSYFNIPSNWNLAFSVLFPCGYIILIIEFALYFNFYNNDRLLSLVELYANPKQMNSKEEAMDHCGIQQREGSDRERLLHNDTADDVLDHSITITQNFSSTE